jgi:hypothetical protein
MDLLRPGRDLVFAHRHEGVVERNDESRMCGAFRKLLIELLLDAVDIEAGRDEGIDSFSGEIIVR